MSADTGQSRPVRIIRRRVARPETVTPGVVSTRRLKTPVMLSLVTAHRLIGPGPSPLRCARQRIREVRLRRADQDATGARDVHVPPPCIHLVAPVMTRLAWACVAAVSVA